MRFEAKESDIRSRWALRLGGGDRSGILELRSEDNGLFWVWADKPAHLVPLVGVQMAGQTAAPRRFFDIEAAVNHLMHCTGVAFRGDCGLEQLA